MSNDARALPNPLFLDPIFGAPTDPVLVKHRETGLWYLFYTQRRATAPGPGVTWVHGTSIGVAESPDGGLTWLYRGTTDLRVPRRTRADWGVQTFWAPEIIYFGGVYHMYVSVISGIPDRWEGHDRNILHYQSTDLLDWDFVSQLDLGSDRVIDSCVYSLPGGGWRMWFKDEAANSYTRFADSPDLYTWTAAGPGRDLVFSHRAHEGVNVFELGGYHWAIVDEWRGQGVFRSTDLSTWEPAGRILSEPGTRQWDESIGHHADVVTAADWLGYPDAGGQHPELVRNATEALLVYFTHRPEPDERFAAVQTATLRVRDGLLTCDRDTQPLASLLG